MRDKKNQERGLAKVSHFFLSGPERPESPEEKVTIQVAARALGVSKGTIITYLNKGQLTRIKESGRIYLSMDEVRAFGEAKRKHRVKPPSTISAERNKRVFVNKKKDRPKRSLTSFGLLESERQYLLSCKAALEAKDTELGKLTFQVNQLKQSVESRASEWKGTETRLRTLEKEQQEKRKKLKSTTHAHNQDLLEEIQARLLTVEEEVSRLRRPWWQALVGHPPLRPKFSRKKGMMIVGAVAFVTILIFSGWWASRSPKHLPSPANDGHLSRSGALRVTPQAALDSASEQEQSTGISRRTSEPVHISIALKPESAALAAQTAQPYTSDVGRSSSGGKRLSFWSEEERQVVGPSSTASPYVLRAETLAATWLQVVIDERQELEYLLHPNENHTWRAKSGFRLHIGNAAGLRLYLNGQLLKPLGESGEVVHLRLPDSSLISSLLHSNQ